MDAPRQQNWPMIGGIAAAAALASFGIARWTAPAAPAPVEAKPAAKAGPVELTLPDAYLQTANIVIGKVEAGGAGGEILAPAHVAASPQGEAIVVARASGAIARITKRLGDSVRAGETLALVESLDAAGFSADRSVAASKAEQARRVYERELSLFKQGVTPRQDMEAAQSALAVAQAEARRAVAVARAAHVSGPGGTVAIVSPIAGRITAQDATLGAYVEPQAELFRVAADGAMQVEASVGAQDARRIAPGDPVSIVLTSGATVAGKVRSITPTLNGASQAATVVITPDAGSSLLIGQGLQVRIRASAGGGKSSLSVPEEAVQVLDGRDVVFVRTKSGFRAQPVLVGARSGGMAQILSGIEAGAAIATRNAFLLKAEATKGAGEEE
ncbi:MULTISPECIES: efflux RND transporter periplasmic adaptor subunit [unclassified Novosphingobium]|uniref:efflux RND transporter periplasmic adaptor subunit n=1 Tax=unclassified Novosphingobium TaxID=2644732 RepID=UPI00086C4562|nr:MULTISPECIES: efflux RND transporter periplasmic adaptor subunit [unclassified Novosphingobium]MBN9144512.1 efflux RND transporter periplasmic adaptor subunit [Novosphingobium sp.]MDR6707843.1 cobalt-zinc-cadmium efflux system membrane fusion protein [Novosphingobium sp. 1748]ODU84059.1 MAG: efflux transporter periplasmic adaptor subunit [Novosphingobium sp. SCN 63-17]OJX93612.1 MAG: efflux transporter periplasmic adaptor subunit [Novosphingobium sp. 63-713]